MVGELVGLLVGELVGLLVGELVGVGEGTDTFARAWSVTSLFDGSWAVTTAVFIVS